MLDVRRQLTPARLVAPLLLAAAGQSFGQSIFVEQYQNGGWQAAPGFDAPGGGSGLPSGSDIDLTLTSSAVIRISTDDPANTDIGVISVIAPSGVAGTVIVARGAAPALDETRVVGQPAARTIAGLIAKGDVAVQIHARTIAGVGVEARRVARIDLTGNLEAPVIHWGVDDQTQPGIGAISVEGSVAADAQIVAVHGRIDEVTVGGDLLGNLAAQNGGIGRITIDGSVGNAETAPTIYGWSGAEDHGIVTLLVGGSIGTPTAPARVLTGGPIIRIEADAVHAEIDSMIDPADPGYLGGLLVRSGDLVGEVFIEEISSFGGWAEAPCVIDVAGDIDGNVIVNRLVRNERPGGPEIAIGGRLTAGSLLSVGGMFNGRADLPGAEIRVGAPAGVEGQIIVADRQFIEFDNDDTVRLAGDGLAVTPDARFLPQPFGEIGGGSVGIAPFNFHAFESFPQHNEVLTLKPGSTLTGSVLRLYGPAFGPLPEFIVEHRAAETSAWTDRSDEFVALAAAEETEATREVRIESLSPQGFEPGEWRLRPVEGSLSCAFTTELPSVRFDSEYADNTFRFTILSDCDTGGRQRTNGLRDQDVEDYVTPVDPGVDPCP